MSDTEKNAPEKETDGALVDEEGHEYFEIKEEVHRKAKEFGIPVDEAARAVYSEKGIKPPRPSTMISSLADLKDGMQNISLKARIVTLHEGEKADGGSYFFGMIADNDTSVSFSAWKDFPFSAGDGVFIQNASVRIWRDRLEVVMNNYSLVSRVEDTEDLVPDLDEGVPAAISELTCDTKKIDIMVRVIELRAADIEVKGNARTVWKGLLADRTGRIPFTCWGPSGIEEGSCYRMIGGYLKEFRGVLNFNFDAGAIIKEVPDSSLPPKEELMKPEPNRIVNLMEGGFSGPVLLRGTIIDVRNGSGLFRRCEQCGRRIIKGQCTVHGKVEGEEDLGMKAIFDDGSGTALLRGDRFLVEDILKRNIQEISRQVREGADPESVKDELSEKLKGRPITLVGSPLLDDYGLAISLEELRTTMEKDVLLGEVESLLEVVV